jgi:hypothetical protein
MTSGRGTRAGDPRDPRAAADQPRQQAPGALRVAALLPRRRGSLLRLQPRASRRPAQLVLDLGEDVVRLRQRQGGTDGRVCGPPQALPPSKIGAAANPPLSSATAQINRGLSCIRGRYGSPAAARGHELNYGWYDNDRHLRPRADAGLQRHGTPGAVGGGVVYNINVNVPPSVNKRQVGHEIVECIREFERG